MPSKKALDLYVTVLEAIASLEMYGIPASNSKINIKVERELLKKCKNVPSNLKVRVYKSLKYGIQRGVLENTSDGVRMSVGALSLKKYDPNKYNNADDPKKGNSQDQVNPRFPRYKAPITTINEVDSSEGKTIIPKNENGKNLII